MLAAVAFTTAGCQDMKPIEAPPPLESLIYSPPVRTQPLAPRRTGWAAIGASIRGKPIEAATLGNGPLRVYLLGGVHGDEPEGVAAAADLAAMLRGDGVLNQATIRIVRDMNPDGSANGTRTNTRGVDLNRNWPARNFTASGAPRGPHGPRPLSELESLAVDKDLAEFRPDVVIALHSADNGPFINFDGPAAGLAYRFAAAARRYDPRFRVQTQVHYATPGSLGSYVGVDQRRPILTVEFARGSKAQANTLALSAGLVAIAADPPPSLAPASAGAR